MRKVDVEAVVDWDDPYNVYDQLADFGHYAKNVEDVLSVEVETDSDGVTISHWVVVFRNGLLRWTEEDWFDRANLRMGFLQRSGDFEYFSGCWTITPEGAKVNVRLEVEFDFGVPSLASIVDPVAERVLHDRTNHTIVELFGAMATFTVDGTPLTDQTTPSARRAERR